MQMKTYSAATMAEALLQVKRELGSEAVILHTRTVTRKRWLGLRRSEVVEITAGRGIQVQQRTQRTPAAPRPPISGLVGPGAPRPRIAREPVSAVEGARRLLETPAVNQAAIVGLSQEMSSLKSMVADLVRESRSQRHPQVPEELLQHYTQLIQSEVAEELAAELVKSLRSQLRADHLRNEAFVRDKLAEQIEKMLPVSGPICRSKKTGPHVVALIGPTGVGKTTTLAKLAANLKLREHRNVGLITIDTYRIAAVDQLKKYADIIGSPLRVVGSPEDLADAIASMPTCDFILIDTAGRSPTDTLKLNELKKFLETAKPDEVHLVLSTTASQECIESAIERFSRVRVDKIIFTKLDEAVHLGVVFNVINKVNKSLSYITTGQDVPDDIEVGRGRRLAQLILGQAGDWHVSEGIA